MTIFGYDIPAVGPVLEFVYDSIVTAVTNAGVTATGNLITISVGTVQFPITGNLITLSTGNLHRPTVPTDNLITISTGGVSVTVGGSTTIGVNGGAITFSIGTPSFTTETFVFPTGSSIAFNAGNAGIGHSAAPNVSGQVITLTLGNFTLLNFIPINRAFDSTTANLNGVISDLVVEDDYDLVRDILSVPEGALLTTAWLTIKQFESDPDSAAIIQKIITVSGSLTDGQITNPGASGTGQVVFVISGDETNLLTADRSYPYDIQVRTNTGKYSTREKGYLVPKGQVTETP